ncbi:hypothetical protein GQ651_08480 [Alphaproteobacteria bacterium GH1-50]|uniref:ParB-like nuclease family protein n=1 Tax=Kangsaoukella pontilimi TaxID=2691042 RepID=A0A7C9MVT1_9RHOB|nr:hypothetical protein [Kangsaoukella pontilimi]MXQ07880.1 hypothetical protein [Kangsaoukella pontilimi]
MGSAETMDAATGASRPPVRVHHEKYGASEWALEEVQLDVHDEVRLWGLNPRLQSYLPVTGINSETELEAALEMTKGYDALRKSIDDLGQMEPIYVWRPNETSKFLVLEGATRVCVLRTLDKKYTSGIKEGTFRRVKAKVLPPNFGELEQAILLARIHVRGSGVRAWDRYIQAKFIHEKVVGVNGQPPVMNQAQMAQYMEKSLAWVNRLKSAYEFALQFKEHVDVERLGSEPIDRFTARNFSVLEEISKARIIGSKLREYDNPAYDDLREDVFGMVQNGVFKEYRDARFLKEFYDDPEAWEQLKSGEEHVANRLAREVESKGSSPKAKIAGLTQTLKRAIDRGDSEFDEEDIAELGRAIDLIEEKVHDGVSTYRVSIKKATQMLNRVSRADVRDLPQDELDEFTDAYEYFIGMVKTHGGRGAT